MFKFLKAVTALKLSGDMTHRQIDTRTQPFIVKDYSYTYRLLKLLTVPEYQDYSHTSLLLKLILN